MQCNLQPLQEYVFVTYKLGDDEETFGQIDEESEDQINNDVGEEVHLNNNGSGIFECSEVIVF